MNHLNLLLVCTTLTWTISCTLHRVEESVRTPVQVPPTFSLSGAHGATPDRWWESFKDMELNDLVERALKDNLDIRQAWARLDQARAIARQAGSGLWPEVTLEPSVSRARSLGFPMGDKALASHSTRYNLSASAAYEVDIWGRILAQKRAAGLDQKATRQDLEATALILSGDIADVWFTIAELKARHNLLRDQVEVSRTFLDLVEFRFDQGLASAVDVYQQRQQLASTRSELPQVESDLAVSLHQLAVLLGEPPKSTVARTRSDLPDLPPMPDTGLPADLLKRRPDVRAGRLRVIAADYRIASAVADRLPALRLSGQTGLLAADPARIFENWFWSIAASALAPVIDGGRRKAEVDRTKAVVTERVMDYGKVILRAIQEVEDAIIREQKQSDLIRQLKEQVKIAEANLRESRTRYVNGLSDYLPVLTALQSLQVLERSYIAVRKRRLEFRIQLYLALGGAWTSELERNADDSASMKPGDKG